MHSNVKEKLNGQMTERFQPSVPVDVEDDSGCPEKQTSVLVNIAAD